MVVTGGKINEIKSIQYKDLTKLQKFPSEENYERASLIEDIKIKSYIYKSVNDLFTLIIESDDNIPSIKNFH